MEDLRSKILADLRDGKKQRYIIDTLMERYGLDRGALLTIVSGSDEYAAFAEYYGDSRQEDVIAWDDELDGTVIRLCREGKKYREIADIMGISMPSLQNRIEEIREHRGESVLPRRRACWT